MFLYISKDLFKCAAHKKKNQMSKDIRPKPGWIWLTSCYWPPRSVSLDYPNSALPITTKTRLKFFNRSQNICHFITKNSCLFFNRLQFFQTWIDVGEPLVYWLSGFYFTQSFMTGVLQNYSRKHKLQIDLVTIRFEITEFETDVKDSLEVGVYIKVSGSL